MQRETIMRNAILTAVGTLVLASPAMAQEFSGPYLGVSLGLSFNGDDSSETILFDRGFDGTDDTVTTTSGADAFSPGFCGGRAYGSGPSGCGNDRDAVQYHVRAGYDVQFGSIVVGAVGQFGRSEVSDSVAAFSTTPASYIMTRSIDWEANLRLRAGLVLGERTLAYATGGLAYARIDNRFETTNRQNAFADNGRSYSWGFVAGGGLEHKLTPNVSMGVEYLHTRYRDDDYRVRVTQGVANAINPFILFGAPGTEFRRSDERFGFHAVRSTLAFRF
jgi:outer membrane immunogenic protein